MELLQLKDAAGEDITLEFCERACEEVQKIARGACASMLYFIYFIQHIYVCMDIHTFMQIQ